MFQSSPVLWDGRYGAAGNAQHGISRFNPRPSCGTGATEHMVDMEAALNVSILARPVGRALPASDKPDDLKMAVSILARPVGRALRCQGS